VNLKSTSHFTAMQFVLACIVATLLFLPAANAQEDLEFRGFIENATFVRTHGVGLTKSRTTLQLELSKAWNPSGLFSEFSLSGTFRGTYDAVYDLNDSEFGKNSGFWLTETRRTHRPSRHPQIRYMQVSSRLRC